MRTLSVSFSAIFFKVRFDGDCWLDSHFQVKRVQVRVLVVYLKLGLIWTQDLWSSDVANFIRLRFTEDTELPSPPDLDFSLIFHISCVPIQKPN